VKKALANLEPSTHVRFDVGFRGILGLRANTAKRPSLTQLRRGD
jgi:hypothetical protein